MESKNSSTPSWSERSERFCDLLGLRTMPVAFAFHEAPPGNMQRTSESAPSGCTFWRRAAEGEIFYTEASDHYNCPIGAFTHGVELPADKSKELEGLIRTMILLEYLHPDEVAQVPHRKDAFKVATYAPLSETPFEPEVILIRANPKQMMLLAEAVTSAGIGSGSTFMGRPTCAAIPEVLQTNLGMASLGCIGNRVYTELPDDEMYFLLPGAHAGPVIEKLTTIVNANRELETFHRARVHTI